MSGGTSRTPAQSSSSCPPVFARLRAAVRHRWARGTRSDRLKTRCRWCCCCSRAPCLRHRPWGLPRLLMIKRCWYAELPRVNLINAGHQRAVVGPCKELAEAKRLLMPHTRRKVDANTPAHPGLASAPLVNKDVPARSSVPGVHVSAGNGRPSTVVHACRAMHRSKQQHNLRQAT